MQEEKVKEFVAKSFAESGEHQKLYTKMSNMLQTTGWTDSVRKACQEELAKRRETISLEELTNTIFQKAANSIPDAVKGEILKDVHTFVDKTLQ